MGLQFDNSALHALTVPNTRTVFFFSAVADGQFDAVVEPVEFAVKRAPTKDEQAMYPHVGVVWHLWTRHLPPGVVPKKKDVIQDGGTALSAAGSERWQVEKVDVQAWAQRYRLLCFQENF